MQTDPESLNASARLLRYCALVNEVHEIGHLALTIGRQVS
jgi:hypothetical protein